MSVLEMIADEFDRKVRQRGQDYFKQGAVKIVSSAAGRIRALVQGSETYRVDFDWGDEIEFDCDCPYFADHGECKHVWATLLEAEHQGLLPDLDDWIAFGESLIDLDFTKLEPADSQQKGTKPPPWKRHLTEVRRAMEHPPQYVPQKPWPANRRVAYMVDIEASMHREMSLVINLASQSLGKNGQWQPAKSTRLTSGQIDQIPDPQDQLILQMLIGAAGLSVYGYYEAPISTTFRLSARDYERILRPIVESGKCFVRHHEDAVDTKPLRWDAGPPWELWLEVVADESNERYALDATLRRGDERIGREVPDLLLADGLVVSRGVVSRLEHFGAFPILAYLRQNGPITLAVQQGDQMLQELLSMSALPRLDLPEELRIEHIDVPMRPYLKIKPPPKRTYDDKLFGELAFEYGPRTIREGETGSLFDPATRTLIRRDPAAEQAAAAQLDMSGFRFQWNPNGGQSRRLAPGKLSKLITQLCAQGWHVEAEGKLYRQPGEFKLNVSSGIDWFELEGGLDFGGVSASLPRLLSALRKGEKTVQLDDGTVGILPEQWLQRYGLLARVAQQDDEQVRFTKRQVGLLDAMLSTMPQATFDATFEAAREELARFQGVAPVDSPPGFVGELRAYQREGLGWLQFLNRFGFGGCLADDMGLGKTVQVLALLESRRGAGKPSLVVVPKSLVFNWREEASRFAPRMRVLDHTGIGRAKSSDSFGQYDVILTTYGTLRLDAPFLKDFGFDYVILDEAQAIKNASSESAKAARLMQADYRLALSGTPIQNHLGELWSLFEFLNPGMLGGASVFRATGAGSMQLEKEARELLSRALRPFILRRTKEQVATELPQKTEQTIWCDMEKDQRKLYDELRDHYRASLLDRIAADGINKSKMHVLEALLRLRQAACHPGLIDKARSGESSAKLDVLLPQISEVIEGHKVLVFSQFTSMLSIVRKHLDKQQIPYEYLDGKTRDRQARVDRFQNDPECRLFLISLKAGGLGLNLTAAEYVFLLDPWWNPAIESQAIDRAHRIGQTRRVFAYRLIARDTVEQKVLELQARKKELADMILNADNSLISKLGREDLELLLS